MAADRNEKGQFEKGRKKTGGKPKDYVSPVKKEFRELMANYCRENYENFCFAMKKCEPKDFCRFYLDALKFNLPMLQSVALNDTKNLANSLTDTIKQLANGNE